MRKLTLVMLVACACLPALAQQPPVVAPGTPQAMSSIGYKSVAAAMEALRKRKDVTFEEQKSGWVNVLEPGGATSLFLRGANSNHPRIRIGSQWASVLMRLRTYL